MKTCTRVTLSKLSKLYLGNNNEKGHEFEREQGGVYGRIWREGREGENAVIIVSKNKNKFK